MAFRLSRFSRPRPARLTAVAIALVASWITATARGSETDQFTVPDGPIADVGPALSGRTIDVLRKITDEANGKADWHHRKARDAGASVWRNRHAAKARGYLSEEYLRRRLYDETAGMGLPECKIEKWLRRREGQFPTMPGGRPLYRVGMADSVFGNSLFSKPLLLFTLSPTIRVFGVYTGLDKFGHVFQQGYEYVKEYDKEESRGRSHDQGVARAVRLGVGQEKGIFGSMTTGVFSNADLAANYAGLLLYLNLTRPVTINGRTLEPILLVRDGRWVFNPAADHAAGDGREVLRPFVTDHFNEALNPSKYVRPLRNVVRSRMRRQAERVARFYRTSREREVRRQAELATWHGEDYGHGGFDGVLTLADTCFGRDAGPSGPRERLASR